MITIEQLNAIPGRPSELEWHPIADGTAFELDRTDTGHWFIRVKADGTAMKFYLSTYPATPTELLNFANYIRRVELDIASYNQDPHYLGREEGAARIHIENAIQDAYESLAEPSCGELHEVEIYEVVPDKVSWCINFDSLISSMHERYYRECDDWASDESIKPLPGAEEALAVWADTYLRPTTPTFARNGKVETRHIAICDSVQDFIVVEDEVAKALNCDRAPRIIEVDGVKIAIGADGEWEVIE